MVMSGAASEVVLVDLNAKLAQAQAGARGIEMTLYPALSEEEHQAIKDSARILREAASTIAYD
jgi:malate/lactate dehydrogenase